METHQRTFPQQPASVRAVFIRSLRLPVAIRPIPDVRPSMLEKVVRRCASLRQDDLCAVADQPVDRHDRPEWKSPPPEQKTPKEINRRLLSSARGTHDHSLAAEARDHRERPHPMKTVQVANTPLRVARVARSTHQLFRAVIYHLIRHAPDRSKKITRGRHSTPIRAVPVHPVVDAPEQNGRAAVRAACHARLRFYFAFGPVSCRSCPHAAAISRPRLARIWLFTPRASRIFWNRSTSSVRGRLNGIPATSL